MIPALSNDTSGSPLHEQQPMRNCYVYIYNFCVSSELMCRMHVDWRKPNQIQWLDILLDTAPPLSADPRAANEDSQNQWLDTLLDYVPSRFHCDRGSTSANSNSRAASSYLILRRQPPIQDCLQHHFTLRRPLPMKGLMFSSVTKLN